MQIPETGFMRLPQILAVFPVSKSTWWAGVRSGKYPAAVKLGPRTTAWPSMAIKQMIESQEQNSYPPSPPKRKAGETDAAD